MSDASLGRCPACGETEYHTVPMRWNVWECLCCSAWSTFLEGQLELVAKVDLRDVRTETDAMVEHLLAEDANDWGHMNRNACNVIHRKGG